MTIINELLATLPDGSVQNICLGDHSAAVVVETESGRQCGLASRLRERNGYNADQLAKDQARFQGHSALALARWVNSPDPTQTAIGMAAVNALLPRQEEYWAEVNAAEIISQYAAHKHVVVVGHFPFISRLRQQAGRLSVLELQPEAGDLPASAAGWIIPQADVVALTGTTLLNRTFTGLLKLCRPTTIILVLGPTTPLSPILFKYGVHYLCGALVENEAGVLKAVAQGYSFKQLQQFGLKLVAMRAFTENSKKSTTEI